MILFIHHVRFNQVYNKNAQRIQLPTYHQMRVKIFDHQVVVANQSLQSIAIGKTSKEIIDHPDIKAHNPCPNSWRNVTKTLIGKKINQL